MKGLNLEVAIMIAVVSGFSFVALYHLSKKLGV